MTTLDDYDLKSVSGGIELIDAVAMIFSVVSYSPVTMAFGYPVAAALVTIEILSEWPHETQSRIHFPRLGLQSCLAPRLAEFSNNAGNTFFSIAKQHASVFTKK